MCKMIIYAGSLTFCWLLLATTQITANSFLWLYIGCYKDTETRAMEKTFIWENARNNTIESCLRHCASLNYSYAGLQYRHACCCGNSYDRYGPLPEVGCNMTCSGNNSQICGGYYANSVYADVDECKSNISTCNPATGNCYNNIGSYRCECKDGFAKINENCEDVDECQSGTSKCNPATGNCVNNIGSYRCECRNGFANRPTDENCEDVDECKSGTSACNPATGNCVNNFGSYSCECNDGFANINLNENCEDVDECKSGISACNATYENCVNNFGSYRCECKDGFAKIDENCEDIDECQLDSSSSPCNAFSEYCVNSIGSYICICKEAFTCGKYEEFSATTSIGVLITFGTIMTLSLLVNVLLVVSRIKSAKSRKSEPGREMTQSEFQPSSMKVSKQHENDYDDTPELVGQNSVYEQIIPGQRRIILNPNSEYAALKHDDLYMNIKSSI